MKYMDYLEQLDDEFDELLEASPGRRREKREEYIEVETEEEHLEYDRRYLRIKCR